MTTIIRTAALALAATLALSACNADKTSVSSDFVPTTVSFDVDGFDLALATKAITDNTANIKIGGRYVASSEVNDINNSTANTALTTSALSYTSGKWSAAPSVWMKDGYNIFAYAYSGDLTPSMDVSGYYMFNASSASQSAQSYVCANGVKISSFASPSATFSMLPMKNSYEVSKINVKCDNPNYTASATATVTYYYMKDVGMKVWQSASSTISPVLQYNYNGTWKDLTSDIIALETFTKDSYTSAGTAFLPPTVRAMKVKLTTTIKDSTGAVYKTTNNEKTFDLTSYNASYSAYKFTIAYTVDELGGPIGFNMTATELTGKTGSFSF